jgi:hypothetical protein
MNRNTRGPWTNRWGMVPPLAMLIPTMCQAFRFPVPTTRHRTGSRHVIPFPATHGLPAEVPAGGRPPLVDGATPPRDTAAAGLLFAQVPARGIGKEITVRFLQSPLAEVVQLVGLALPDGNYREPAAAFAAAAAGAGGIGGMLRFHSCTLLDSNMRKDNGSPGEFPVIPIR